MIKKTVAFFMIALFCMPVYAKSKIKVYPNPWIPESGKSLSTPRGDELKHGGYTADGWIKFEGVAEGMADPEGNISPDYSGTLRIYDITGHLIRHKRWTIGEEMAIPLPELSSEIDVDEQGFPYNRNNRIVHWDGRNNDYEYVESGVYIWIIQEDNGQKHDGKVVVIR